MNELLCATGGSRQHNGEAYHAAARAAAVPDGAARSGGPMLLCCLELPSIGGFGAANRAVVFPRIAEGARNAGVSDAARWSPNFAMRVSRVVALSPSRSAAPPTPRIRHAVLSSTLLTCSLSTSTSRTLCRVGGTRRQRDRQTRTRRRRSPPAPPDCAAHERSQARDIAAACRCCLSGSTRCASRTPSRIPRRSATPA